VALEEKEMEDALTDVWKTLSSMDDKISWAEEDAQAAREASKKAKE